MKTVSVSAAVRAAFSLLALTCVIALAPSVRADTELICDERPAPNLRFGPAAPDAMPSIAPARPEGVAVEDAQWTQMGTVGSPGSAPIYDPVRDRLVVFGGQPPSGTAGNGVWVLPLGVGALEWQQLQVVGGPPPARAFHTAIYDPIRDRILVYAGTPGSIYNQVVFADVWALSLAGTPTWTNLQPTGTAPSSRALHNAVYDSVHDRMIVYGGMQNGAYLGDAWALSLAGAPAWTNLTPAGTAPTSRDGAAAIYDPAGDRVLIFGGEGAAGTTFGDLWQLSLTGTPTWSQLTPSGPGPSPRYYSAAALDASGNRMLLYSGISGFVFNELWELQLGGSMAWNLLTQSGSPPTRIWPTVVIDSARDRMLLFGGGAQATRADLWALPLEPTLAWSELMESETVPDRRYGHTATFDPARDRLVSFAGVYTYYIQGSYPKVLFNDVDALSFTGGLAWTTLAPQGTPPNPVWDLSQIYDPIRDRIVEWGGRGYYSSPTPDVMALSLSGTPTWSVLSTTGQAPSVRYGHSAIYDRAHDRMIVFGGRNRFQVGGVWVDSLFDEVWALSLANPPAWTKLEPAGTPPTGRVYHSAVYDPAGDRMVVFGGLDQASGKDDVWALSLGANPEWTDITPAGGGPVSRYYQATAYDSRRHRMVVFGGKRVAGGTDDIMNDVWGLSLNDPPAWTAITPTGPIPAARYASEAVYDSLRDRMVMYWGTSGYCATGSFGDAWTLQFDAGTVSISLVSASATPDLVTLTWSAPSSGIATVYRREADGDWAALGMASADGVGRIVFEDRSVVSRGRYAYRLGFPEGGGQVFTGEVWVTVPDRFSLSLRGALPNPSAGGFEIGFALPDAAPARLELLDVAGRRIASREVGSLGPGGHTLRLRESAGLAPGVYVVRLARGDRAVSARACIVR